MGRLFKSFASFSAASRRKMVVMRPLGRFLLPKTLNSAEEMRNVRLGDTLRGNIAVFQVLGFWSPERCDKWFVPYAIYSAFMIFWTLFMWNLVLFIKCFLILDDLEQAAASIYIISTTGVEIIKAYYLLKNRYHIGEAVRSLDRDVFRPRTVRQFELMADLLRFSQMAFAFFVALALSTCFFWATFPIFDANEKRLPFNGWFPWDWTKTPAYELCYAYQVLGVLLLAMLNVSIDTTAAGLMTHVCAQLDLLTHKMVNMYEETESKLRRSSGPREVSSEEVNDAMYESLAECVRHHENILELTVTVGRVFNVGVFYEFIVTGATLCMTMFQLTVVRTFSFEFFSLIGFQICTNMEIAMYCLFGNEVILRSQKVLYAAFSIPWQDCSPKFKKNLLFFMLRLSKPIRIRAGGFFILSVETFLLILRSSWSYFAVLRQVHSR